jgi:hypothetical protein
MDLQDQMELKELKEQQERVVVAVELDHQEQPELRE